MYEKQSMSRGAVSGRGDHTAPPETLPLTEAEILELADLLSDSSNTSGNDLLAFSGARSVAGLVTRIVMADPPQRRVLLVAIRRTLATRRAGTPHPV